MDKYRSLMSNNIMSDRAQTAAQSAQDQGDAVIRVENVTKLFRTPGEGTIGALQDVSMEIGHSEFVTVVGPSGCGKSTLLKLIAGFSAPSSGRILFQGEEVRGLNTKTGYVPQESKLFPWLTVEENVGFGLNRSEERRVGKECRL